LDEYVGYGTSLKNPDEFKLDMSERIHMLGASMSPFLSWLQKVRTKTATQVMYSWIESEMFTQRDIKCRLIRSAVKSGGSAGEYIYALKLDTGADWMAFAAAAKADAWVSAEYKPLIYMNVIKGDEPTKYHSFVIEKNALLLGQTLRDIDFKSGADAGLNGMLNTIVLLDTEGTDAIGGEFGEVSAPDTTVLTTGLLTTGHPSGEAWATMWADGDFTESDGTACEVGEAGWANVYVSVVTPNDFLKGYAQGSGLPTESRRTSRSVRNYTQIFKTPYSVANTLKAITAAGGTYGGDELARRRLEKAIEHKIDIETAIMFQGGGVEGTDWGEIAESSDFENPLTRFKGLGVGLAVNGLTSKPGFIISKNCDLDTRYVFNSTTPSMTELNRICEMIFDDNVDNPSGAKTVLCSQKWLATLAAMGLAVNSSTGMYTFGERIAAPGELGILVRTILTPMGRLDFVHLPRLRGKYENYALVCDFANMEWRPLVSRATSLTSDAGRKDLDGQLDFYLTEGGFECRHESTHAVIKLG
jgi:hypothetical protein